MFQVRETSSSLSSVPSVVIVHIYCKLQTQDQANFARCRHPPRTASARVARGISSSRPGPCGSQPRSSLARIAWYWAFVPQITDPWGVSLSAISPSISTASGDLMRPFEWANVEILFEMSPKDWNHEGMVTKTGTEGMARR